MRTVAPACVVDAISEIEIRVLRAYVEQDTAVVRAVSDVGGAAKLAWHEATEALIARGALLRTDRGVLVTPEGAAALLDVVPIEVIGTASLTAETAAAPPGDASRRSTAPRRSAGSSSRRARATN